MKTRNLLLKRIGVNRYFWCGVAALMLPFVANCGSNKAQAQGDALPLIAHWTMDSAERLTDSGPSKLHGSVRSAESVAGQKGQALQLTDKSEVSVGNSGFLGRGGSALSVTAWIKTNSYPTNNLGAGLIAKRAMNTGSPFIISLGKNGELGFEGYNGLNWDDSLFSHGNAVPRGQWAHIAMTFKAGEKVRLLVNGKVVAEKNATRPLAANDQSLQIGRDPYRGAFTGAIDEVKIFAASLTTEQVTQDMTSGLPTREAKSSDFSAPMHVVQAALVRYDMPFGFTEGYGRTRATAERKAGPDAIDWPKISWGNKQIFKDSASENLDVRLREEGEARPLFQQKTDEVLEPGHHWFRPLQWMWGQRYIYTDDRTARSWHNDYELWTFPVEIRGTGEADVKNVVLRYNGQAIYENAGPLRSLTLLLPQNQSGKQYELLVGSRGPVKFDAGLQPIIPGSPREVLIPVNFTVPGAGPKITVRNLAAPQKFPAQEDWQKDLNALQASTHNASAPAFTRLQSGMARYIGFEVPRSPLTIYALDLPHGMSSGFIYDGIHTPDKDHSWGGEFRGTVEEYAKYLADTGYDMTFEHQSAGDLNDTSGNKSRDALAAALARHNIKLGLTVDTAWKRPFLGHPNVAFFAHNLADWRAPLYRDLQIMAQHMHRHSNFAGVNIGADNGAYVSFWDWAPPIPNRPWAEAFNIWTKGQSSWPEAKSVGGSATTKEFVDYVQRYNQTFASYGYFANALREVDRSFVTTTGSYGSSPGVGARGGWPWATIPAKEMHATMDVQQAYDWDEKRASKPLHNVALTDRIKSYAPQKQTWSLIDNFLLKFGREARQRAYALALTRGVNAVGSNWLALPTGPHARPQIVADHKELNEWMRKFGGAYASTRNNASLGILFVQPQALLRRVNQNDKASDEDLINGSHEGKTTEALFLAHAAGWPARIITPEEIKRGLPASMKAVLLVGLNSFDSTWNWYDGLETDLQKFVQSGGRLLADHESVGPNGLPIIKTGMKVRSYITQGDTDQTPTLFKRNTENIKMLQAAMQGIKKPVATSNSSTIWAIPHTTGDVQYVTVVNQGWEEGKNATQVVKPQSGQLIWNRQGTFYNLRLGRKITSAEAQTVDLTKDAFQTYALTPQEITAPQVSVIKGNDGFYVAKVAIGSGNGISGVPVQLSVSNNGESVTVYGASGSNVKLPVREGDAGDYSVTATELLSNQIGKASFTAAKPAVTKSLSTQDATAQELARFAARKDVPLVIALTPEQEKDTTVVSLVQRLKTFYTIKGRKVSSGRIAPGTTEEKGVVLSLQTLRGAKRFPQWRTVDADLILLGNPSNNVLLLDQQRGLLLNQNKGVTLTYSPFVGERQVLNILSSDLVGLQSGVNAVIK